MKKFLLFLLLVAFLILSFILFNTLTFKSRQLAVEQLPLFNINDSCVARLQKSITFKTISFDDSTRLDSTEFLHFQQFLIASYPVTFKTLVMEKVNKYSIILHWKGKSSLNPVVLMAHQDVVPIEEATLSSWDAAPFSGALKDGFVYGRGTIDDKGSLIAILESVELLVKEGFTPSTDIYLIFGHDEEVGGKYGAKVIAGLFKQRNIRPAFVLDEGGIITKTKIPGMAKPVAVVGISEKGYLSLNLKINIPGGHSSMPEQVTALDEMAKAVVKLKESPFKPEMGYVLNAFLDYVGPEMSFVNKMAMANRWLFKPLIFNTYGKSPAGSATIRTTTATTIFESGIKDNIVPGQAKATVNFRTQPGTTKEDVISYVRKVIDNDKIEITPRPFNSETKQVADVKDPSFNYFHRALNGLDNTLIVAPYLVLGATDGRYFGEVTNQIFRFIPFTDPQGFHGINERIPVEEFKTGINFYYQLIKNYKP